MTSVQAPGEVGFFYKAPSCPEDFQSVIWVAFCCSTVFALPCSQSRCSFSISSSVLLGFFFITTVIFLAHILFLWNLVPVWMQAELFRFTAPVVLERAIGRYSTPLSPPPLSLGELPFFRLQVLLTWSFFLLCLFSGVYFVLFVGVLSPPHPPFLLWLFWIQSVFIFSFGYSLYLLILSSLLTTCCYLALLLIYRCFKNFFPGYCSTCKSIYI